MTKKKTLNSTTKTVVEETRTINKTEIPIEQVLAYIIAKIDHLGDLIEERFPKKVKLTK